MTTDGTNGLIVEGDLTTNGADEIHYSFHFRSTEVCVKFVHTDGRQWYGASQTKHWQKGFRLFGALPLGNTSLRETTNTSNTTAHMLWTILNGARVACKWSSGRHWPIWYGLRGVLIHRLFATPLPITVTAPSLMADSKARDESVISR